MTHRFGRLSHNELDHLAERLDEVARQLEHVALVGTPPDNEQLVVMIFNGIIEVVGGLGKQVVDLQELVRKIMLGLQCVGCLADSPTRDPRQPRQCPECGLPLGTNAGGEHTAGCTTCQAHLDGHLKELQELREEQTCSECNCKVGTNIENCSLCALVATFGVPTRV